MEAFIHVDQFNFIKRQVLDIVNAHVTSNDKGVVHTFISLAVERVDALFPEMIAEQKQLLTPIPLIDDKEKAEKFFADIKPYVIPFHVTEQGIKKLFPKVKKLKVPELEKLDLQEICYLSWIDYSMNKKFIITRSNGKLVGVHGTFDPIKQKGICAICNGHEEVGLFLTEKKGQVLGTYTKKGNYICRDSDVCNQNITAIEHLHDFVSRLKA
ncbi:FusB/FusC family EF-G-binding protein [Ornithinibacillus contaminans]|uniref:FusB/FusC family EF-G-binding protein n=1 Tax=Ornithinibacillus contaminans TaxID=694055 RepID=UPI00064D8846|nr:elongation factor G-binding protein [Ornithinibacillus contaminans]